MNAEVFWISATELEFCGRIYTWDGWCWTDKNGVSRTLYLKDKGVIMGCGKGDSKGRNIKGDSKGRNIKGRNSKGKKQKGDSKGRNNKGDNKGKKAKDIQFDGDNKEGDNEESDNEESDNTEGDNEESDNTEPDTCVTALGECKEPDNNELEPDMTNT